jgi:hypothetical protein
MENGYSLTQTTNLTAIVGVIVLILNQFKISIGNEELATLIGAGITIVSIVLNFRNRYKKGDLTLGGKRLR